MPWTSYPRQPSVPYRDPRPENRAGGERDNLSRRFDGHLNWSVEWPVWTLIGTMVVLLACSISALAGPLDACTRTRVQTPHPTAVETRHAINVELDRALMRESCE